jgi:hypothetical protein
VLFEPVVVAAGLAVLARSQQGERALAIRRRGRDRRQRGAAQRVAQADARPRDQLRHGVAVHLHELGDLVVGQVLELTQHEHLALARGQLGVRVADLVLARREEDVALRVVVRVARVEADSPAADSAAHGHGALGDRIARLGALAALDQVVAGVTRRGKQVGAKRELAPFELRQPLEDIDERLLGGVRRVVLGAEDAQAQVVGALLVPRVERRERVTVTRYGALSQSRFVCGELLRGGHSLEGTTGSP